MQSRDRAGKAYRFELALNLCTLRACMEAQNRICPYGRTAGSEKFPPEIISKLLKSYLLQVIAVRMEEHFRWRFWPNATPTT
jgi:hypothetical protein